MILLQAHFHFLRARRALIGWSALAISMALAFNAFAVDPTPALCVFPGAVGYGADTPAGRGGAVLRVTSLDASGPGTLVEAISHPGPRVIVFEIAGVIDLQGKSLTVTEPFVTIAGETAPGDGITLIKGSLRIETHDVLIQHLRIRPGDDGRPKKSGFSPDGVSLQNQPGAPGAHHIVIDHCSTTWAVDENLSTSGQRHEGRGGTSHQVTISNCIIAEGLRNTSHEKGPHSMGTLIHDHARDIAVIANLYADNDNRNPVLKPDAGAVVANNLIYNPGVKAIHSYWTPREYTEFPKTLLPCTLVAVGNVLWYGPDTPRDLAVISLSGDRGEVFASDNIGVDLAGKPVAEVAGRPTRLKDRPFWPEGFKPLPAGRVAESVLSRAGAWPRDAIDARIIRQTREKSGRVIDSQEAVGGYPNPPVIRRPLQIPANPSADDNGDGYTNLENWLHRLAEKAQTP